MVEQTQLPNGNEQELTNDCKLVFDVLFNKFHESFYGVNY